MTAKLCTIPTLLALALALALTLPRGAAAVDGVIEINQARALAGYVTATDAPGFPVTIDSSGSYRLTGNLSVGENDGIVVTSAAVEVALDLNGFSIAGAGCCNGVYVDAIFSGSRARISNGSIRSFVNGINGFSRPVWIASLHVVGGDGIGVGINAGNDSVITDSVVELHAFGIVVRSGSVVRGCTSKQNAVGIETGSSSLVSGNNVSSNNTCGIYVEDGCTVVGNNVNSNSIGVRGSTGVTLLDNTVRSSSDFGFRFDGANNGYARNVLTNNNGGDANAQVGGAGTGIQIGTNICGNDTVCP